MKSGPLFFDGFLDERQAVGPKVIAEGRNLDVVGQNSEGTGFDDHLFIFGILGLERLVRCAATGQEEDPENDQYIAQGGRDGPGHGALQTSGPSAPFEWGRGRIVKCPSPRFTSP